MSQAKGHKAEKPKKEENKRKSRVVRDKGSNSENPCLPSDLFADIFGYSEFLQKKPKETVQPDKIFSLLEKREYKQAFLSGKYVYVDGYFVLRSAECLELCDGQLRIKDEAKTHLDDFALHYEHITFRALHYRPPKEPSKKPPSGYVLSEAKKISSVSDLTTDNLHYILGSSGTGGGPPPPGFGAALIWLMEQQGVTEDQLANETGLSARHIQRLRNDLSQPTLETVIAICIGLHLDPSSAEWLVEQAGYRLTFVSERDRFYRFFIGIAYKESVYNCNELLKNQGLKPLTGLNDE